MTSGLVTRVVPPILLGRRSVHLLERNVLVYRRAWMILFSGFFEPVFYLFSMGVGLAPLVGEVAGPGGRAVGYAAFVAPALLAASAMNGAVFESTMNIFFKLRYGKVYDAMLSTPMEPADVALGELAWALVRGGLYAAGFLVVMAVMGLMVSPLGVLALPAALLVGFAFGGVGMAATTYMTSWQHLDLVQLVVLPLFLFSATFYPLEVYPPLLQAVTQLSPLYHGVVVIRSLTLGILSPALVWHAGFLLLMGAAGLTLASRRIGLLLRA